jgi:hypothetical protein
MKIFFLNVALSFMLLSASAQGYVDSVFSDSIKTIQLHRTDWELSYPVLKLNSDDQLELTFDELTSTMKQYYYTIEHCSSDWNTSDITYTEYADGYMENPIYSFKYSISTTFKYIHYTFTFPNDQLGIRLSGNYVVKVYEDHDPTKIVIIKRFYVVDSKATFDINISRPVQGNMFSAGQQIDFKITHQVENLVDPQRELRVIISQNFSFHNAVYDMPPVYMEGNLMDYTLQKGNIFLAGSEFRNFDITNVKYVSAFVQKIELHVPYYHFYLAPSLLRTYSKYTYDQDINGRYKIAIGRTGDPETDADYVFVHFALPMDAPDPDGDFYVFGLLSDWRCKDEFKMIYNFDSKSYEVQALLKQGYYNFEYVYKRRKGVVVDHTFIEGNHWETENDYYIFFYYRPFAGRYEQLIGLGLANSIQKTNP